MPRKRAHGILDALQDLGEFVVAGPSAQPPSDVLLADWRAAERAADAAYDEWRGRRDRDSYAVYRACADQADAAQAALATRADV